ncbi:Neprilysin-21 [Nymphon striatum]|nr:Neprilysin-21 [Nymphon striatum]
MHTCAKVHMAMIELIGNDHKTSQQHIELGASRIKRDNDDLERSRRGCVNTIHLMNAAQYHFLRIHLQLNAHATIGEILADAAGVMSSYEVFTSKSKGMSKSAPKIFGDFTDRQLYWIAYAQSQCSKATKQERARSQLEDAHPPSQIRINGIVKHSEQFQLDFNCRSCDDMNAKKKCSLWT